MRPDRTHIEKCRETQRRLTVALLCAACIVAFAYFFLMVLEAFPKQDRHLVETFAGELLLLAFAALAVWKAFRKRG